MTISNKLEFLYLLIKRAEIINDAEKEQFFNVAPLISNDQIDQTINFFVTAENDLKDIRDKYQRKKSQIYTAYTPKLNEAFQIGKKMVYQAKEAKSLANDHAQEDELLNTLSNI